MKRALIIVTNCRQIGETGLPTGWNLTEVAHAYSRLRRAGYAVDFASPQGGATGLDEKSRDLDNHDNRSFIYNEQAQAELRQTLSPPALNPADYQVIFFAGGHGALFDFPESKALAQLAVDVYEHGGIIATVSHGAAALLDAKLSNGKPLCAGRYVTLSTREEEEAMGLSELLPIQLEELFAERGAFVTKIAQFEPHLIIGDHLVMGQNFASASRVMENAIQMTKQQAQRVAA